MREIIGFTYPGQVFPQLIYIYVSCNAAWYDVSGALGYGCSPAVFHDRHLRFELPHSFVYKDELEAFFEHNKELIEKLQESYTEDWNESSSLCGKWDEKLKEQLEDLIRDFETECFETDQEES